MQTRASIKTMFRRLAGNADGRSRAKQMKGKFMQRTFTGVAVVAALSLTGLSAHASCADPRLAPQQGLLHQMAPVFSQRLSDGNHSDERKAGERIVGTWLVTYTGPFAGQAFIQWHSDGTEWENIDLPILGGTICMGDWKAIDEHHVRRSHVAWTYTNGIPSGYLTETETDEVARDGSSYRGINDVKVFDVDGNLVLEASGTAVATRISPP